MSAVPKLRFPEFDGEWVTNNLSTISDVRDGTHDTPKYVSHGFPLVTSKNLLKTGDLDLSNVSFISKDDFLSINRRSGVDVGDILFGMIGTIGNPVRVRSNEFAIKNVALIKEVEKVYLSWLIHFLNSPSIDQQFHFLNSGGTQKFISLGAIRNIQVCYPSLPEQQKIASFLSSVDKKIDLLRQKKDALELYKKGLMQKIFSQEIRFKQDDGSDFPDWEEVALGDVLSKFESGKSKSKNLDPNGEFIVIDMGGVDRHCKIVSGKRTKNNKDLLQFGQLVMPKDDIGGGNIIGKVVIVDKNKKYVLGDHVYALTVDIAKADQKFIFYRVNSSQVNTSLRKKANGTAQLGLGRDAVLKQEVMICCLAEQEKIASVLSAIDNKIQNISSQIEQMETFKKGLLQQMFV